jgi:hypothetical protein
MSTAIFVLTDSLIGSITEWQRALDADGLPLRLPAEASLDESDTWIAQLRGKRTSFQYWITEPRDVISAYPMVQFGHDWKYAIAFPYIRDFAELTASWMAAAAYARATGGIVFDESVRKIINPNELVEETQKIERDAVEAEAEFQEFLRRQPLKS